MGRVLTDVHVNEMLSVLVDRSPHVRFALLVLVSSGGGDRGLLLAGGRVSVRHHGFVRALADGVKREIERDIRDRNMYSCYILGLL